MKQSGKKRLPIYLTVFEIFRTKVFKFKSILGVLTGPLDVSFSGESNFEKQTKRL